MSELEIGICYALSGENTTDVLEETKGLLLGHLRTYSLACRKSLMREHFSSIPDSLYRSALHALQADGAVSAASGSGDVFLYANQ